jgi:hypothetical protein
MASIDLGLAELNVWIGVSGFSANEMAGMAGGSSLVIADISGLSTLVP